MLLFAEIVEASGVPKGAVSIMPMDREVGDALVEDPRFKLLSFTGSPDVGWEMKRRAGMKKVVLELGGNAGVIVDADADLDFAVNRIRVGAFAYSGQVCISVQRVFVRRRGLRAVPGQARRRGQDDSSSETLSIERPTSAR